ncbi:MAG: hypothetical protein IJ446_09105 [Oscillospiraceae bacterium]|nr:hypothetical protein [Oscillospiraceae bacterium]
MTEREIRTIKYLRQKKVTVPKICKLLELEEDQVRLAIEMPYPYFERYIIDWSKVKTGLGTVDELYRRPDYVKKYGGTAS